MSDIDEETFDIGVIGGVVVGCVVLRAFSRPFQFHYPSCHQQGHKLCLKVSMRRPTRGVLLLVVKGQDARIKSINVMPEQIIKIVPKKLALICASDIEIICDER